MADAFILECLVACQIDREQSDALIAEAHSQLNARRFRQTHIAALGGPPELSRDDRVRWVIVKIIWDAGYRPDHAKFRQLTTGLRLAAEAELKAQQPVPATTA